MGEWYSADWQPGVAGAGDYQPHGVGVELLGGPLDGRRGHVANAIEALWLARAPDGFLVRSTRRTPHDLPADWILLGRYALDVQERALRWYGLEDSGVRLAPEPAGERPQYHHLPSGDRPRFGSLWRERETPPSPLQRLWRRLSSVIARAFR